jgi:lipopolysaccharide export system protein LptC
VSKILADRLGSTGAGNTETGAKMSVATLTTERDHGARSDAEQELAFRAADRHTKLVRVLRRALPVCAALAAALYLVTSKMSFSFGPLEASVERVEVREDALRMVNPKLEGFDKEKGGYSVTADYAEQSVSTPNLIRLFTIKAEMAGADKDWSRLTAKGGDFDSKAERLTLREDIVVSTSSGMSGALEIATIDMKSQTLTSERPVAFDLINGTVRADTMEMQGAKRLLNFRGRVKVHIRKRPEGAPPPVAAASPAPQASAQP